MVLVYASRRKSQESLDRASRNIYGFASVDSAQKHVIATIRKLRMRIAGAEESQIHDIIAASLTEAKIVFRHTPHLGNRCIPDFLTETRVIIEVKKGRPPATATLKQITRYAALPDADLVILVAERGLPYIPANIEGKPIVQIPLYAAWGIAL